MLQIDKVQQIEGVTVYGDHEHFWGILLASAATEIPALCGRHICVPLYEVSLSC